MATKISPPPSTKGTLEEWDIDTTAEWFQKWCLERKLSQEIIENFISVNGADLAGYSKEDLIQITKREAVGIALFNALNTLKEKKISYSQGNLLNSFHYLFFLS